MGLETATIALIVAGVGTAASIQQGAQSRKESRKAARAQQRIAARESQREKLAQLREAQIQRAQILQAGATGGVSDSSAVQGGVGSIGTQAASNISFIQQIEGLQKQVHMHSQKAADFSSNASDIGAVTNLAVKGVNTLNLGGSTSNVVKQTGTGASATANAVSPFAKTAPQMSVVNRNLFG